MQAQGSELTNKYAEGYPKARYYGGCNIIDKIETIAINRAKKLFSAEHANVQPHSGSNANLSIYMSSVLPGDTIMSMALDHGGHLTHGSKVNFTGKLYNFIKYGVDRYNGLIDYNKIETLANKYLPKLIIAGASAYTRIIDFKRFGKIAKNINAKLMVDMAHISGLVAAQLHPSPIEYSDYISSTTHKTLRGPRGGIILCKKNYKRKIDSNVFPGIQGGPLEHIIAAKAIALKEASSQNFKIYQTQVIKNAKTLASSLINYEFNLVSGGTDNHLILIDLRNKNISGKEAEELLDHVNIVVNKNKIPYDNTNAKVTSGLRLGTPSITTRGMKSLEMKELAKLISQAIYYRKQNQKLNLIKNKALELALSFPLNEQYQNSYIIK
jgi:glycine hydroxymethyltransferase